MNRLTVVRAALLMAAVACVVPSKALAQSATPGPTPSGSIGVQVPVERADAANQVCHSHSTGATCTITVGAAGTATQYAYLTGADITTCQDATGATPAAPTFITTTGLNGNPQYQVGSGNTNAAVVGTCQTTTISFGTAPLRSQTAGTNVTFVLPSFVTHQTISLNVYFRLAAQ